MIDPLDVIKLLLRRGVDIHARDTKGRSILHFAVLGKRFERFKVDGVLHEQPLYLRAKIAVHYTFILPSLVVAWLQLLKGVERSLPRNHTRLPGYKATVAVEV